MRPEAASKVCEQPARAAAPSTTTRERSAAAGHVSKNCMPSIIDAQKERLVGSRLKCTYSLPAIYAAPWTVKKDMISVSNITNDRFDMSCKHSATALARGRHYAVTLSPVCSPDVATDQRGRVIEKSDFHLDDLFEDINSTAIYISEPIIHYSTDY